MKTATSSTKGTGSRTGARAAIATQELKVRIRASRLGDVLAGMACDLCLEQVPVEEALQMIQERAIERMVAMLDTAILLDETAMQSCLDIVAKESEHVALQALEKGTDALREGLEIYDGLEWAECTGPVN
jgi:predicted subunit of tRNA(5-methylaminomethyl-2-thiouridylate) methyltransferase